jgi:2-polyprenyl-3-methyl-5-hydroxy-6-metoxy-1,4-benzoquinol methylase
VAGVGVEDAATRKAIALRISRHFTTKFDREWVKWKLLADPLFATLVPWLREPQLPVLDVGCGRGLLGFYLRECGVNADYVGIDFDALKIQPAQAVAANYAPPPQYHLLDARQIWPDARGHVCLLDVLHYLPATEQAALLKQCAAHVSPGGSLIVRSGIRDTSWRYRFTAGTDKVMASLGLMKSPPLHYPTLEELDGVLRSAGLEMETTHAPDKGSMFNNYLRVYRRSGVVL